MCFVLAKLLQNMIDRVIKASATTDGAVCQEGVWPCRLAAVFHLAVSAVIQIFSADICTSSSKVNDTLWV